MLNIPATVSAPLPATYEAARSALAHCQAIDECKDWADKAAALASYARQSEDLELEKMAIRIRQRALRRASEIARQMMQPHGTNRFSDRDHATGISIPKEKVQEISGFSRRQLDTALAIGNIPQEDFDRQVESANPPTLTELARQGVQKRETPTDPQTWLKGRSPQDFNAILHMMSTIEEYAKEADTWPLNQLLGEMTDKERQDARKWISRIDAIHDQIMTRI
jgi:hypothetical protein